MNYLSQALYAISVSVVLLFVIGFVNGCASPQNKININVSNNDTQDNTRALRREMQGLCSPRSKCPQMWKVLESHLESLGEHLADAT